VDGVWGSTAVVAEEGDCSAVCDAAGWLPD